jgi:ribonuclease P protein component
METLKTNRDFERVFRKGKSAGHRDLVILGRKGRTKKTRVGFCISRKTGNAVTRNKLRRRLKEIFREVEGSLKPRWEIVIVAKETTTTLSYKALKRLTLKLLDRLGVPASQVASPSK